MLNRCLHLDRLIQGLVRIHGLVRYVQVVVFYRNLARCLIQWSSTVSGALCSSSRSCYCPAVVVDDHVVCSYDVVVRHIRFACAAARALFCRLPSGDALLAVTILVTSFLECSHI